MYVRIKCFLKYYTIAPNDLRKLWMKILNPISRTCLAKEELMDLFERFARGRILDSKILVSAKFSEDMIELLVREGCENPEDPKEIKMSAVLRKLDDGTLDIELFNQMIKTECTYAVWSKNHVID